jgi:predicted N-acyltransferase
MPIATWSGSTTRPERPLLHARILESIDGAAAADWNALDLGGRPFLRHEFLAAAERSGSAAPATGWTPRHVVVESGGTLLGAMPLYLKSHSWGEFVFDFAWARAYEQHGLDYYPKLVSTAPFTPAAGPKFLVNPAADADLVRKALLDAARELGRETGASTLHALFIDDAEREWLSNQGLMARLDCQFHWHNRQFGSFEDFLGTFTAEKRKKARRERRRVQEAGIHFVELHGGELAGDLLEAVYALHARTFAERGNPPYFRIDFFSEIASTMPAMLMVKLAMLRDEPVACAVFLRGTDTLYGRYWGATGDFHSLHFEACYYQGIDYCIREGLARFEPGTQGEHKIARGFSPTPVWSMHEVAHPAFRAAVGEYLGRERAHVQAYIDAIRAHVPFRRAEPQANLHPDVGSDISR